MKLWGLVLALAFSNTAFLPVWHDVRSTMPSLHNGLPPLKCWATQIIPLFKMSLLGHLLLVNTPGFVTQKQVLGKDTCLLSLATNKDFSSRWHLYIHYSTSMWPKGLVDLVLFVIWLQPPWHRIICQASSLFRSQSHSTFSQWSSTRLCWRQLSLPPPNGLFSLVSISLTAITLILLSTSHTNVSVSNVFLLSSCSFCPSKAFI